MKKQPETYEELDDDFCSNFDGRINTEIAEQLKRGDYCAAYPGWDFYGKVWFDKESKTFCCKIMCYGAHVATIEAEIPEELVLETCETYGYK